MEAKKRFLKALILGAVLGITYEFIVTPIFTKPIEKKVEEIIQ